LINKKLQGVEIKKYLEERYLDVQEDDIDDFFEVRNQINQNGNIIYILMNFLKI
jgi:C4-dicarboxylate transporter